MSQPRARAAAAQYKVEAGTDARYLQELLTKMLRARVFLDSSNLGDLRALYDAVHESDVLVLIGTSSVLTRPYCLLEIWEAWSVHRPVLIVPVAGLGFSCKEAFKLLSDLETELPQRNPDALDDVLRHLDDKQVSLEAFQENLIEALQLGAEGADGAEGSEVSSSAAGRSPRSISFDGSVAAGGQPAGSGGASAGASAGGSPGSRCLGTNYAWQPHGSHNSLVADAQDLIEAMGQLTGRTITWPATERLRSQRGTIATKRLHAQKTGKNLHDSKRLEGKRLKREARRSGGTSPHNTLARLLPSPLRRSGSGAISWLSTSGGASQKEPKGYAIFMAYDYPSRDSQQHARELAKTLAPRLSGNVHVAALDSPLAFRTADASAPADGRLSGTLAASLETSFMDDLSTRLASVSRSKVRRRGLHSAPRSPVPHFPRRVHARAAAVLTDRVPRAPHVCCCRHSC